jgi:DNA-binding MarR family transcriptional regulator
MKNDISNFLMKLNEVQLEKRHRTLPVVQITILYELWKTKGKPVPLLEIQYKYNFERFTVSRNSDMLSYARIKDNGRMRQGKGWIIKNHIFDKYDSRMKEAQLTPQGKRIAERLFSA